MDEGSICKIKKEKVTGQTRFVSVMLKLVGEVGISMVADLIDQIMTGIIPGEKGYGTIVNCCEGKGNAVEKGNCRGLIREYILKIVD